MSKRKNLQLRRFRCNTCGKEADAPKSKGRTSPGHIKTMYCYVCRMRTNHTQLAEFREEEPMNEMQIFNNTEFGQVRTITEGGNTLFCGKDVTAALGYKDAINAIKQHCRGVVKRHLTDNLGRNQETNFIPEGDLYRLIANSQLPSAERFERWVFDEVLPSIRKHGGYLAGQENMDGEQLLAKALLYANNLAEERQRKIEEMTPKAIFADAVTASSGSILIGELAKFLRQNGVETGQNRLFSQLRDDGYLIKRSGSDYNMPTQRSMEMGLFTVKETTITHADGHITLSKTTKVTGKGQQYFINRYLSGRRV